MSLFRLWTKYLGIELAKEMTYKTNFFIKVLGLVVADVVGPLITLLIYSSTAGIPGWTFEQFILFQGTFILVFGLGHTLCFKLPFEVTYLVREGKFNKIMTAPLNPLTNMTFRAFDMEGLAEVLTGLLLIGWALQTVAFTVMSMLFYILFVLLGVLFLYSVMVIVASLSFMVVKTFALVELFFKTSDMARYPATIYGSGLRFFVSLLFPVAAAAYFPASTLINGVSLVWMLQVVASILAFFVLAILLWEKGMQKHTSSGG